MVAVKFDEYSSIVWAVTRRQRLQEGQVLQRGQLRAAGAFSKPRSASAARSWPIVCWSCSFCACTAP